MLRTILSHIIIFDETCSQIFRPRGVKIASRYVTPSAHLTIGRFITKRDFETEDGQVDHSKVKRFIETIDEINEWPAKGALAQGW